MSENTGCETCPTCKGCQPDAVPGKVSSGATDVQVKDQHDIIGSVTAKIPYEFYDKFLVKELAPLKIKRIFETPIPKEDKPVKDDAGVEAVDYDEVKKEEKIVDSKIKRGVILKVPAQYESLQNAANSNFLKLTPGDVIMYQYGKEFDLLKDAALVAQYDILGKINPTDDNKQDAN
jgi:hypothetical protein